MKKQKKHLFKRLSAGILAAAITISSISWWDHGNTAKAASNATLTVDMTAENHEIVHGAAGFLYGISSEGVPTTNTLTPLKPKILATKGALGTEHPYGDALDVAKTFLESGGEQVQMYNSNYYGVFGVLADYKEYSEVLETIIAPAVVEWKKAWNEEHGTPENPKDNIGARINIDKAIVYIPINEGTPIVGGVETAKELGYEDKGGWIGNLDRNEGYFIPWQSYYEAINKGDPNATVAGPNCWGYNGPVEYKPFLKWCFENDCLPDIATWHELSQESLRDMSAHLENFKMIWKEEVTDKGGPELPQIVINEYAQMIDCGVPGRLVNWMARLEDEGIYGCLPFWHQANNLNDLTADANEGNGAWWLFKWYGDMSGKTLKVESNTSYEKLYGLATLDDNKQMATALFGGIDGQTDVILKNVTDTETFKDADRVNISIESTYFVGFHGALNEPAKILEGTYPVNADGSVTINMKNMKFSDAYRVNITKADEDSQITDPLVNTYHIAYEAENSSYSNGAANVAWHGLPGSYYFSGDYAVSMAKDATLTYTIDVPVDGKYRMDFVYANGMGANAQNMESHAPYNVNQRLVIDGGEGENVEFKNTLMAAMTGLYTKYVDLTAGSHTFTFTTLDSGTVYHDVAYVTYSGAINEDVKRFDSIYEAEQADFNEFTVLGVDNVVGKAATTVSTKTEFSGYSGNGYVIGLADRLVTEGGGIRWNVIVEKSGLYNITLRYQSDESGKAHIYIGNTTATLDNLVKSIPVSSTDTQWKTVIATAYLQKGINIVDVDATSSIALDYMRVQQVSDEYQNGEAIAKNTVIEAEEAKNSEELVIVDCDSASNNQYVEGLKGSAIASDNSNQYLEFEFDAVEAGVYQMQVFQSNDSICGTHAYNIKIIDKYAIFEIRNEKGEITSTNRHFFINTFSAESFREKTIPMEFSAGKNTVRVYNDDSWNVLYGGTQSTPGDNEMENYTPNFDKFVINATALENAVELPEEYGISIKTTAAGYASTAENYVERGGTFHLSMIADKDVDKILVDGKDKTTDVVDNGNGTYSLDITEVQNDVKVVIYFTEGSGEHIDQYIVNAGFGTGTTHGWITDGIVQKEAANEYKGNFLKLSAGQNVTQKVTGVPEGAYWLNVYAKADSTISTSGSAVLRANDEETTIETYGEYTEVSIPVNVATDGIVDIEVDANGIRGSLCLDNFSLQYDGSNLLYFVDAGDHDPTTLSSGDRFGQYNSVTDQMYSVDSVSGNKWGLLTFDTDPKISSPNGDSKAAYTEYQRANLNNGANDGLDKKVSFRYAHGQTESGISPRYVKYAFTLPAGKYEIEAGVGNSWGNSGNPALYTGIGINRSNTNNENLTLLEDVQKDKALTGTITLDSDTEEFVVAILSEDATINLNYIKISEVESALEEIVIKELPNKLEYNTNEDMDLDGLNVVAKYDDGSEKELAESNFSVSGFNSDRAATRTLTVSYMENGVTATKTFSVDVLELGYFVDAGDITISTVNDGDAFGKYNSGITDQIYNGEATGFKWGVVTSEDDINLGDPTYQNTTYQRISGNLGGTDKKEYFRYADGQDAAGIDPRYVKYAFTLPAGEYKIEAGVGNAWGNSANPELYTGTGINASNQDNSNLTLLDSLDEALTPYGGTGILSGKVTVDEDTEEFIVALLSSDVTINLNYIKISALTSEKTVEKLVINQMPNKIRYANGELFEMDGLSVTAYYDDGTTDDVVITEDMLTGFDANTAGKQTVTITYSGKTTIFNVTVDEKIKDERVIFGVSKSQYLLGEEFDPSTVIVNIIKTNGSRETVPADRYSIDDSEFVKDAVGTYPIRVNYDSTSEEIYVKVVDTFKFSHITAAVSKKECAIGETFNPDSVVITAVYGNGTGSIQKRVLDASDYAIDSSAYDAEVPGIYKVIVSYKEQGTSSQISFNVRVVDEKENLTLMYFVDAGDHDPTTINPGDHYGINNSVTDQLFGADPETGKNWGALDLLDPDGSRLASSGWKPNQLSKALYTQYTRAYSNSDYDCTDGLDKTHSFRYASGQDSSPEVKSMYGEIYVDYKFELEKGKQYKVELFVTNPWGNAWEWPDGAPVSVYTNKGADTEQLLADVREDAERNITGYAMTDEDGYLTVNVRRPYKEGKSVMVNYIKIYEYEVRLKSINIGEMPAKITYTQGEELDLNGLKVIASYTDGTKSPIDLDNVDVTGYDPYTVGVQTVTVSYTETYGEETITRKARFEVTVEEEQVEPVVLDSLAVTAPNKTVYEIGDEFNADGMVVKAVYSDGTEKVLSESDYSISGFDSSEAGIITISVSYEEDGIIKTAEYDVTINEQTEPVVMESITVTVPNKTIYEIGDEFDAEGMVVTVVYSDDTEKIITEGYTISGFNTESEGTKLVTVSYEENGITDTKTFEITVNSSSEDEIASAEEKAALNTEIQASKEVNFDDYTTESAETLQRAIAVAESVYANPEAKSSEVEKAIAELESVVLIPKSETGIIMTREPNKVAYIIDEELDLQGMSVSVTYDNGTQKVLNSDEYSLEGFDSTIAGEQTITVSYNTYSVTFEITVTVEQVEIYLRAIEAVPPQVEYFVGDILDLSVLKVSSIYSDGSMKELNSNDYTTDLDTVDMSVAGEKTITVTYEEGEKKVLTTFKIIVNEIILESLKLTPPAKTEYEKGEELDITGLMVIGVFSNGTEKKLAFEEYTISGYDKEVTGEQMIVVTNGTVMASFKVIVKERPIEVKIIGLEVTAKTEYQVGDKFDTEKLSVTAVYSNGTKRKLTNSEYEIRGFNSSKAGTVKVTVRVGDIFREIVVTIKAQTLNETIPVTKLKIDNLSSQKHTGKALRPKVVVKNGHVLLREGIDYILEYKNNIIPGKATLTIIGKNKYTGSVSKSFEILAARGKTYKVGKYMYKVTNASTKTGKVTLLKPTKKTLKSVVIPATVKIGSRRYKVTQIAANAFKDNRKLTNVRIGNNVAKIGDKAFSGDKKLTKITVSSKLLTRVGKNAFKNINKKAVIKAPASKLNKYKKIMKNKGQSSTVKIKK